MSYFSKMNGGSRESVSIRQIRQTVKQKATPEERARVPKVKYDPKSPTKISRDNS